MRWGRVLLWTILTFAGLMLLGAGAIELLLRSDLPRRRVVQAIEDALAMDVQMSGLRTRWGGRTELTGLTITPPLEQQPIAVLPAVEVDHTSVLWMIVSRSMRVDHVRVEGGDLFLRQNASGRWNLQDVIDPLTRETREEQDGPSSLPEVAVDAVTVHVAAANGQKLKAGNLRFRGEPVGRVAWRFDGAIASDLEVSGRVALDGGHRHEVTVTIRDGQRYAQLWWADAPSPLDGSARWQARFDRSVLRGRLQIDRAQAGHYRAAGPVWVTAAAQELVLDPRGLVVSTDKGAVDEARLVSGRATVRKGTFTAEDLTLRSLGAVARINGTIDYSQPTGNLEVAWSGEHDSTSVEHEGQLKLALRRPTPDRYSATIQSATTGQTPWGRWDAQLRAQASGEQLTRMQWRLTVPRLAWFDRADKEFILKDLSAAVAIDDRTARVEDLRLAGDHQLQATGEFHLDDRRWSVTVAGDRIIVPGVDRGPVKLAAQARRLGSTVEVQNLAIEVAGMGAKGAGSYDPGRDLPLDVAVEVWYELPTASQASGAAPGPESPQWAGRLRWEGSVVGDLEPRKLLARGQFTGEHLIFNGHALHDLAAPLRIEADEHALELRSEGFELLAGRSSIDGRYGIREQAITAQLELDRIALGEVVSFVNPKLAIRGSLNGDFAVRMAGWNLRNLTAEGDWSVEGFESKNLTFDRLEGRLMTERQVLRLEPITMSHRQGLAEGEVTFDLADARTLTAELEITRWPHSFEAQEVDLTMDGEISLRSDLIDRWVHGRLDLSADLEFRGRPGGKLWCAGQLTEDAISLNQLRGELLDGTVEGQITIDLSDALKSTGQLTWEGIEPSAAGVWWEHPRSVGGRLSGELTFAPATGPRPLEPLRYQFVLRPEELMIRNVPIGHSTIVGYIGPQRWLIDESDISLADGKAEVWASATRRNGHWHTHAQAEFAELNLDQLNRFVHPDTDRPVPGRVTGVVRLLGPAGAGQWPTGNGRVRLTDSDLVNANILGVIFRVMGVSPARTVPEGEGTIRLSLENKSLRIQNFRYFNRGVEALGDGVIEDLSLGRESPINIFLIGAQRPFRGWDVSFLKALDDILAGLQSNLTTVRVRGTLGEPDPQIVPLAALSEAIQKLLLGHETKD